MSEDEFVLASISGHDCVADIKRTIENMDNLYIYRSLRTDSAENVLKIRRGENNDFVIRNYQYAARGMRSGLIEKVCTICKDPLFKPTFSSYIKTLVLQEYSTPSLSDTDSNRSSKAVISSKYGVCHTYCAKSKAKPSR